MCSSFVSWGVGYLLVIPKKNGSENTREGWEILVHLAFNLCGIKDFIIRIPSHKPEVIRIMKHAVRQMLWYVRQDSTWLSIYLKHKISVIASKGKTMAECLRSHIRLARSFTQDQISHTTKDQRKLFLSRSDCAKVGDYWGLLIEHDHKHICDHVSAPFTNGKCATDRE